MQKASFLRFFSERLQVRSLNVAPNLLAHRWRTGPEILRVRWNFPEGNPAYWSLGGWWFLDKPQLVNRRKENCKRHQESAWSLIQFLYLAFLHVIFMRELLGLSRNACNSQYYSEITLMEETPANQLRLVVDPSLVISPHLKKYARQIGSFPQTKGENKTYSWNQNTQKSHCEPRVFTRSATNPRVPWPVVLGVNRWCWRRCNCSSGLGWNSIIGNVAEGPGAMFLENDDNTTPGWWF